MTERLGRYQLIKLLASGGMGEIYLAEHTGLSGFAKRVAVKRIRPDYAKNPSYLELFLNEARVGSFLNHPNIVHIFDVGQEHDSLWLVMEYVDGVDLKRLLRRAKLAGRPLSPVALAAIAVEVLSALEEAHAGGPYRGEPIIHRDVSPENVLIARSGSIKVLDFGLAKWAPDSHSVPSMEGNLIFGKVRYMPPEQLKGRLIDVRADLFALGVVLYEALAGVLPFGADNANAVLARIMEGPPPPPTRSLAEPDLAMDALVYRAISPSVERRFQSAIEMREALIEYLDRREARLPLEGLRRMLLPGSTIATAHAGESQESGVESEERLTPTEIGLAIARRCGKCGGGFSALYLEGMIVDRCNSCRGMWLDAAEMDRILGIHASSAIIAEEDSSSRAPLDALLGSCPVCKVAMRAYAVPGQPAAFEVCPHCFGSWFDRGEIRLLQEAEVGAWYRALLDSLRVA